MTIIDMVISSAKRPSIESNVVPIDRAESVAVVAGRRIHMETTNMDKLPLSQLRDPVTSQHCTYIYQRHCDCLPVRIQRLSTGTHIPLNLSLPMNLYIRLRFICRPNNRLAAPLLLLPLRLLLPLLLLFPLFLLLLLRRRGCG
eukprot:GHVU01222523.1.p2 GENE.GHVU01222523.1~~GHVU01222523.1.p2  ORF type:complete len:143 (-),score=12.71 GHVU01222523.1:13-441(-)